jgi:hypothetical protein
MTAGPLRRELKFLIHHGTRPVLLERWRRYLVKAPFTNEHAVTPILSQYYDSPALAFYQEKLDGIGVRNKVRLRTYGREFRSGQTSFLEIKHRENDFGWKYRYRFPHFDVAHLDPANWTLDDPEMQRAIMALRECYRLRPSAQVYYQREAYQGAVERDVRITLDSCLVGLHPGEKLTRKLLLDERRSLMPDTLVILEVKTTHGIPPWVHEGVVAAELQQQTIPKYITAVEVLRLTECGAVFHRTPDASARSAGGKQPDPETTRRKAA